MRACMHACVRASVCGLLFHAASNESIWLEFRMDLDYNLDQQWAVTMNPEKNHDPPGFGDKLHL